MITSTDRQLRVGGHQLRVHIRHGAGNATPLLLCGGIGASYESLQPLVDAFDPAIEIIRFDVPGVGGSPSAPLPLGFPYLAWLLTRLLEQLDYQRVDVLGYSWGGGLAQQFAVQHPGRCRRLVLASTSTGALSIPGFLPALTLLPTPQQRTDPKFVANLLHAADARRIITDTAFCDGEPGLVHQLTAVAGWTSLPFLPLIEQDVLILSGNNDSIVPVLNARILANLIPRAQLHVFAGGHDGIISGAADLTPRIQRFLTKNHHAY